MKNRIITMMGGIMLGCACIQAATVEADVKAQIELHSKKMSHQEWSDKYDQTYNGWFGDGSEVSAGWITTLGPLGICARSLDATWQMENFRKEFPKGLCDAAGNPVVGCYVVTQVIAGGPADGKVQVGDVIVGMSGELFKPALQLEPKHGPYALQHIRGIDMHAGLLVDKAEGVGSISMMVIPAAALESLPAAPNLTHEIAPRTKNGGGKPIPISVAVEGGGTVVLEVTDGGNGRGSDGWSWRGMQLVNEANPKEVIDLSKKSPIVYQVGHGGAEYDKKDGQWLAHAPSVLEFAVPAGKWRLEGTGIPAQYATVEYVIKEGRRGELPSAVKSKVQDVSLKIPQLGSYAEGFPKNCPKSAATIRILSEWLAAQQNEDGSWSRYRGYTQAEFDTGFAGIALMATGDKKYDAAVKKAAHWIAFSGTQDWWGVPQSVATIFLCEYWLRFKDDSVLQAIRNNLNRLKNEVLYGDYTSGHGIHPGYRGTGVSVGGSHLTLAFALASKTPARAQDEVLDKLLDRAQELCSTGFGPYGRMAEDWGYEPNYEKGASYSGRHGPYFLASLIAGGPALYTKNAKGMYGAGAIGNADNGHSTETLSLVWAIPCTWRANPEHYQRHLESMRWKLALSRTFDGGMAFLPNRSELMTAEHLLDVYIRTSAWLLALCSPNANLAITGKPEWQAKQFRNVPPIFDPESRLVSTTIRNWSLVEAALGTKAPESLKKGLAALQAVPRKDGCRTAIMDLVKECAPQVAKDILALPDAGAKDRPGSITPLLRAYCAEVVLGVEVRILLQPDTEDGSPFSSCTAKIEIQQPFAGRNLGIRNDNEGRARISKMDSTYTWPFSGEITLGDWADKTPSVSLSWGNSTRFNGALESANLEKKLELPACATNPVKGMARIKMNVNGVEIAYSRPVEMGGFEVGCGERARPVVNDRKIWVPGKLLRTHGNWGGSFITAKGDYISATAQGNQLMVHDMTDLRENKKPHTWVSPNDASLMAGSSCWFHTSTGSYGLEASVPEVYLLKNGAKELPYLFTTEPATPMPEAVKGKPSLLEDKDSLTSINSKYDAGGLLVLNVQLSGSHKVEGVDLRMTNGRAGMEIDAWVGGKWVTVYWGQQQQSSTRVSDAMRAMYANEPAALRALALPGGGEIKSFRPFGPVSTDKLRLRLKGQGRAEISELRVYAK